MYINTQGSRRAPTANQIYVYTRTGHEPIRGEYKATWGITGLTVNGLSVYGFLINNVNSEPVLKQFGSIMCFLHMFLKNNYRTHFHYMINSKQRLINNFNVE